MAQIVGCCSKLSIQHEGILKANELHVEDRADIAASVKIGAPKPPAKKVAFVTCMDARMDMGLIAGIGLGEAHVIRNAGGRASDDAIRSLVFSHKLLGTEEFFVIHHTDCGLEYVTSDDMGHMLAKDLTTAAFADGKFFNARETGGAEDGKHMNWLCIKDQRESIRDDVERIVHHALVDKAIPVHGYLYDVKTGRLHHIHSAGGRGVEHGAPAHSHCDAATPVEKAAAHEAEAAVAARA